MKHLLKGENTPSSCVGNEGNSQRAPGLRKESENIQQYQQRSTMEVTF